MLALTFSYDKTLKNWFACQCQFWLGNTPLKTSYTDLEAKDLYLDFHKRNLNLLSTTPLKKIQWVNEITNCSLIVERILCICTQFSKDALQ